MEDKKIKVLFVDDDTDYGNIITAILKKSGYDVLYSNSLINIDTTINEFHPSIVLFDVEVGDSNSIDVFESIKEFFPGLPFIFISSHVEKGYFSRAISQGGYIYLKKPVDSDELIAYIARYAVDYIPMIKFGNFSLNKETRELKDVKSGETRILSKKEYDVLELLVLKISHIISREDIMSKVWKDESCTDLTLNNIISRLRKYISSDTNIQILTSQKKGYWMVNALM